MSWLTRIRVDFGLANRLRLHDNYAWHRTAWELFPGRDGKPRHFLSRLNVRQEGFELLLLAQESASRPSWCPQECYDERKIRSSFLEHQYYRFDLRANPTRKVAKPDKDGNRAKNGRRLALLQTEDQLAWLGRKADGSGFRILESPPVVIDPATSHTFRIPKQNRHGLHLGVSFRGLLEVTDRREFQEAFHTGIGSAKAFGFGMLVLAPVHSS
jgi:CRISPR system Cascade subunit CasE